MNRHAEVRAETVRELNDAILDAKGGHVVLNYVLAKRLYTMISEPAVWQYFYTDEGHARWKCSNCGKIVRYPFDKVFCSACGKPMKGES